MYKKVYDIYDPHHIYVGTVYSLRDAAKVIGCSHEGVRKAVKKDKHIKDWYVAVRELDGTEITMLNIIEK